MGEQSRDRLSHWWWPGQWLRIVYGVWVDQLWYWQNVRPRLRGRLRGLGVVLQALLGSALLTAVFTSILGAALDLAGVPLSWPWLMVGGGVPLGVAALFGLCTAMSTGLWSVALVLSVVIGMAGGLTGAMALGLGIGFGPLMGAASGVIMAIGVGVVKGIRWGLAEGLGGTLAIGVAIGFTLGVAQGLAGSLMFAVTFYLGGLWVTRQISDEGMRRSLADPD